MIYQKTSVDIILNDVALALFLIPLIIYIINYIGLFIYLNIHLELKAEILGIRNECPDHCQIAMNTIIRFS